MYRGHLMNCEDDNMNAMLEGVTVTGRDGKAATVESEVTNLEQVYLRGSQIRYFILPDMPLWRHRDGTVGRGAGRGVYGPGGKGRGKGSGSQISATEEVTVPSKPPVVDAGKIWKDQEANALASLCKGLAQRARTAAAATRK
eukprot:Skav236236  [mRNA]  locus=scaffold829:186267:188804:- [translate_table: standard]